jgi:hypothetical protein
MMTTMQVPKTTRFANFPGHLRDEHFSGQSALHNLLSRYDNHAPFVDDCVATWKALAGQPETRRRTAIAALARRWNLDRVRAVARWQFALLEQGLDQAGKTVDGRRLGPFSFAATMERAEGRPQVTHGTDRWEQRPSESLAEFRDRIASDLNVSPRSLPAEIVDKLRELAMTGAPLADTHHADDIHTKWLFWRLCPGAFDGNPLAIASYAAISDRVFVEEAPVRVAVTRLAKRLEVDLPRRRRGRPTTS